MEEATSRQGTTQTDSAAALLTPTKAEVDLEKLWHNVEVFRRTAPEAEFIAVVKADAYGHGAERVARSLGDRGIDWFAVATVAEAVQLRRAGVDERILVLASPLPELIPAYARHDLDLTVSSLDVAQIVAGAAARAGRFRVHVKVDTGMGRIGISPEEAPSVFTLLEHAPGVSIEGIWTHFATADDDDLDFAFRQLALFENVLSTVGDSAARIHLASSSAVLRISESFAFPRAMVRVGIGMYGYSARAGLAEEAGLKPVMRLVSRVTQTKWVEPGTSISYDRRWTASQRTKIATVGAGYADGYPRLLTNWGEVGVRGSRCPVAGTVCMDMLMIDVGPDSDVAVGDEAVLFGDGAPDAYEIAQWAQTIPYEVLTGIAGRVPRIYLE